MVYGGRTDFLTAAISGFIMADSEEYNPKVTSVFVIDQSLL